MEFCLEENHFSDEMSAASASAYSWSESEELITVGNADDIYNEMVDTRTAILDESEDERFDESDLSTAILDDDEDLITAVSHDYSAYSLPASETFVDMDVPTSMGGDRSKFVEAVGRFEGDAMTKVTPDVNDYLEGLALNESAVGSELNKAFLEAEETDKERTDGDKDPYDFDTAIEA
ncbi:hypothetical protein OSTOST_16078 [Ostertagia ostertagi]